jgi:tetratricopeptide (TPR) repeat protein
MKSQEDSWFFSTAFNNVGFTNITCFHDSLEAYEHVIRHQYDLFVIRAEMPKLSGTALLQKMRQSGNYGLETHFFVADQVNQNIFNILVEHDIAYVLVKPFNMERIEQKLQFLMETENNLPNEEQMYRNAKAALYANQLNMAFELAQGLTANERMTDKIQTLMGDIELKRGNIEAARERYIRVLKKNPNAPAAAHKIAETHMKEGNFTAASSILEKQAAINPLNIRLLENAGISYLETGETEKAKACMSTLQTQDPVNKVSGEVLASVYVKEEDYRKVADSLMETHSGEDLILALNNYGVKLSKANNSEGALIMYHRCLESMTDTRFFHFIYYNMASAYRKINDLAKAKEYLEKALKINPSYDKAREALKKIG